MKTQFLADFQGFLITFCSDYCYMIILYVNLKKSYMKIDILDFTKHSWFLTENKQIIQNFICYHFVGIYNYF